MRWSPDYNGCLTIGANVRGLYLGVLFLSRVGHSPSFMPWSDVQMAVHKGPIFTYFHFTFPRVSGVVLGVDQQLGRHLTGRGTWSRGMATIRLEFDHLFICVQRDAQGNITIIRIHFTHRPLRQALCLLRQTPFCC
jgi:hypothetical protein